MLALYLGRFGHRVLSAMDGQTALNILAEQEIDVVLLDLMLPRVDGFDVLRLLHERQPDPFPYVIVVSAAGGDEKRKRALELGADEYIPKPFKLAGLVERIQALERRL
jgi:DNA-binding response OmpR family regulator